MIFLREGVGNYSTFGNALCLKIEGGNWKIPFHGKGQLISEWNFGVFKSPQKPNFRQISALWI